jgi:signal transduction histidine kinase
MNQKDTPLAPSRSGRTLVEHGLVASLGWLITIRWIAGVGVLAATWFTDNILGLQLAALPLYAIGISILAYNVFFYWVLTRLRRESPMPLSGANLLANLQIAADWLAMTLLIHLSGGVESPAILYFFLHITLASILLSTRVTYLYAALATFLVGGTVALEYVGLLPHVSVMGFLPAPLYQNPTYVGGVLSFFVSTMFVIAYLATGITSRLCKREAEIVELGQSLERAYARLQTLYEGARAVSSTLNLQQVLDRLVQDTTKAMGIRACSIRLLDETGTQLRVAAVHGLSEAYVKKGNLELERNPLAREALGGKVVVVRDLEKESGLQFPAEALTEGIRSTLTMALPGKNESLGIIRAYSDEVDRFSDDDAAFLTAIAGQGSIAIENALAYQALAKLDQMKSSFVRTVTHELRSPVSVVRSLLRTMLAGYAGALTDPQRDIVERAQRRADFLQTLVDDLLDLASGKSEMVATPEHAPVLLNKTVERVIRRFEIPAKEKQIDLEWQCEGDALPVTISAVNEDVDRILNNLMSNAIKYTPSGGHVSVHLHRVGSLGAGGSVACLEVSDTGIGIPKESIPHLFEEFYRAPNAKAQEKEGTGLGLVITKDLVTRYGGHIAVQSKLGEGTTFTVMWPIMTTDR